MARTLYTLQVSILRGPMTEAFMRDHPVVTRTIEICGDQTLNQLHRAIFEAYDRWDDCHLSEFHFGPKPRDRHAERYVLPFIHDDPDEYDEQPAAGSTTQTRLGRLGLEVGSVFWYWYDFGDDWYHEIRVLAVGEAESGERYPRVAARVGDSPPQYVDWDADEEDEDEEDDFRREPMVLLEYHAASDTRLTIQHDWEYGMTPALWTAIVVELDPLQAIRALADIGWPALEFSTEHLVMVAEAAEPERLADDVRALVDDLGIAMPQAHLLLQANVASADDAIRERDTETLLRQIELCERMGITVGVIHPGGDRPATLDAERDERARRIESFTRLAGHAAQHGVSLAVENMCDVTTPARNALGRRNYGATIPELHELIDAVGMPNMGICYDTGHGNIQGLDMAEAVRQCGERLIATHIQDSDGTRDQHYSPMRGSIDWEHGIAALREIGYAGLFNLEIPGERGLPVDLILRRMEGVLATTLWLLERGTPSQ